MISQQTNKVWELLFIIHSWKNLVLYFFLYAVSTLSHSTLKAWTVEPSLIFPNQETLVGSWAQKRFKRARFSNGIHASFSAFNVKDFPLNSQYIQKIYSLVFMKMNSRNGGLCVRRPTAAAARRIYNFVEIARPDASQIAIKVSNCAGKFLTAQCKLFSLALL